MNSQTIVNALIVIVLVGWIASRQLRWRPVVVGRMWRMPILFGVIGIFLTATQSKGATLTTFDIAVLAIELVIALGVGAIMGRIAQFRPLPRNAQPDAPEYESRTGWVGMVLWVVMIGIRVGIDIWASGAGATIVTSTGIILLVLAANRLARTGVFAARVARLDSVAA
jgi:hypothetical protein